MIDFRCTQCGRLLRTPDDAAGKQAQCPSCAAIQPVPTPAAPSASANPLHEPASMPTPAAFPPHIADNPYAGSSYDPSAIGTVGAGPIVPSRIDAGIVVTKSWQIAKPQILWLFLFGLIYIAITQGISFGLQIGMEVLKSVANLSGTGIDVFGGAFVQISAQLVGIFLAMGVVIYMLKLGRGQPASLLDLFSGLPYLFRAIVISLLLGFMIVGIAIPFFIPVGISAAAIGIDSPVSIILIIIGTTLAVIAITYVWLVWGQCFYVLIDRNAGILESLSVSRQITAGNRLAIFLVYLLSGVFGIVAVCAFCLPYFFAIGFGFLMMAVCYLMMTGQPTGADAKPFLPGSQGTGGVPQPGTAG